MKLRIALYLLSTLALPLVSHAAYDITPDSIYKHIAILASDSMEGREVGEPGEWKAAQYLVSMYQQAGLEPKGDNGSYLQAFEFNKRIDFGPKNRLAINGQSLSLREEFMPMYQSASAQFMFKEVIPVGFGITTADSVYDDYAGKSVEGKAVLIKRFAPKPESNPHVDFDKYSSVADKIINAIAHKAAAVFFITPEDQDDTLPSMGGAHVAQKSIPIVFLRRKGLEKLNLTPATVGVLSAMGETELTAVKDTGYNVVAYLPTGNDTTVIIGAHYDHLGWGTSASRYLGREKLIHYGADDNGSGTAGLLELARHFSSIRSELRYSLLFVSFSGEEAGILGSSYFARNWTIDSSKVRMMLNMDMIGRLRAQDKGLAIFGTGTCTEFKQYFDSTLKDSTMKLSFQESGTGPSDHTAFYTSGIPVLHFFTGAHEDYHKPEDVVEKIDTHGVVKVVTMVAEIVHHFDHAAGQLTFQKTKDAGMTGQRSFSVTLGVMPDYVATVKGLRVDGVSPDRPAEKAGILKGDVIIKMGQYTIDDIYAYMNALGKFRKGDSCQVALERGADTLQMLVHFK